MKIKYLLIIFSIFLLTGCYNYKELNELAITTAIGIDKTDKGYKLTTQIINTQKTSSEGATNYPQITVYSSESENLLNALRDITLKIPNRLYMQQLQVLLISEEIAKDGIKDTLDMFFRNVESRKRFYVIIAKDKSSESILKTLTPVETIVGSNIKKTLVTQSNYLGVSELVTFEDLMNYYLDKNLEITLPSITIAGNEEEGEKKENIESSDPNTKVILENMAIFKGDKLITYLTKEESIMLNFTKNNINNTLVSYVCNNDKDIVLKVFDTKTELSTKENKLKATYNIKGSAIIGEINCQMNLERNETIEEIEKKLNEKIEHSITNTINNIKNNYNTDVFGILDSFYKSNNAYYKKIKDAWYESNLKKLKIEVKSEIKLIEKGNVLRVIKDEK